MPIYTYRCPNCEVDEDVVLPIDRRDATRFHICGCTMQRRMTVPRPPIMKPTGRGMALDSLNGKDTAHMRPETKLAAAQGLNSPEKVYY